MIELQLKEHFLDSDAIRDRTGPRIRSGHAEPEDRGEAIVLQEISNTPEYHLAGEAGIGEIVVQIDCYSSTPRHAYTLGQLVRNRISGYRGIIGKTDPQLMQSCRLISSGQEQEEPQDASRDWTHRYRQDFALFMSSTIPTFT